MRAAERRLACNPLDGNAWLRYAMVEERSGPTRQRSIAALRASYWTAPSEGWIIEPRLALRDRSDCRGRDDGFEAEYVDDLRRFVSFESTDRVAAAYVAAPAPVRDSLAAADRRAAG